MVRSAPSSLSTASLLCASGEADLEHAEHLRDLMRVIEAQQADLEHLRTLAAKLDRCLAIETRAYQRAHADVLALLGLLRDRTPLSGEAGEIETRIRLRWEGRR